MINIYIQLKKCVAWSLLICLLTSTPHPNLPPHDQKELESWGIQLGTSLFASFFIKDALLENVRHVDLLPKMGDV